MLSRDLRARRLRDHVSAPAAASSAFLTSRGRCEAYPSAPTATGIDVGVAAPVQRDALVPGSTSNSSAVVVGKPMATLVRLRERLPRWSLLLRRAVAVDCAW